MEDDRVALAEAMFEASKDIAREMPRHQFQVQEYCGRHARVSTQARNLCRLMTVMEHMGWSLVAMDAELGCIFRKQT